MANPAFTPDHRQNGQRADSLATSTQSPAVESAPPDTSQDVALADASEPSTKPPKRRPSALLLVVAGVGLIAGSVFGSRWWAYASTHEETDNAQLQGHVYQISSRVPGKVAQVAVEDNQPVAAGDLLVQLDASDYDLAVKQAQAALAAAQKQAEAAKASISQADTSSQAQVTSAQGGITGASAAIADAQAALEVARAGVPVAQAQLAQAEATLQKATTDYQRYQGLYAQGAISAQDRDAAKQAYDIAQAQRQSAQQQVTQAQAKVTQAQEGVAQAQAQLQTSRGSLQQAQASGVQTTVNRSQFEAAQAKIAEAEASLKQAQLQLSYTAIQAPAAGVVGHKTVEVGQQVQPGQPLMAVVGTDLWIEANFKETQIAHMRPGEPVEITVDALPGHTFKGQVESLSPASGAQFALLPPDNATGNFTKVVQRIPVKISLDLASVNGFEDWLAPGLSATVSVDTAQE
ncbi:HlyD family secretion protein [Geitlerinema sp. PCC 7407]|uniref:HlyD family secretion protein n=1 Tax=Geitlerinema sp. PCC 7407 TaxID=1173025 RepID=UPI00029F9D5F|nr:HlyD family secretion protein [Geitlerinema sp. PCC 7407]AFY65804.1 secretion protein HlyD family protein [Geitlerinema sp. PCC 7407]